MDKLERTAEPVNTPMRTEAFYIQREAFALLSAEEAVAAAMRTAAGIAAALALDEQKPVYDAPVSAIQKVLADTGVIIHFDDAWVPADQTADTFAQTEGHL